MTMNPFEQNEHLLHFLTSQVEREVIDYIRQEIQHDAPESVPTADELLTFFQFPDEPTELDAYQQMLATDKLLEYAEISLRTLCDLIRYRPIPRNTKGRPAYRASNVLLKIARNGKSPVPRSIRSTGLQSLRRRCIYRSRPQDSRRFSVPLCCAAPPEQSRLPALRRGLYAAQAEARRAQSPAHGRMKGGCLCQRLRKRSPSFLRWRKAPTRRKPKPRCCRPGV